MARALGFVGLIVVARALGETDLGRLSFATSVAALLSAATDFGLSTALVREIAREPQRTPTLLRAAGWLRLAGVGLIFAFAAGFWTLSSQSEAVRLLVVLACLTLPFSSFSAIGIAALRARQEMRVEAAVRIVVAIASLVALVVVVHQGAGIVGVALVQLGAMVLTFLLFFGWTTVQGLATGGDRADRRAVGCLVQACLPFAVGVILGGLSFKVDAVLLQYLVGDREVGVYVAAYRVLEGLLFFPGLLGAALLPALCAQMQEPGGRARRTSELVLKYCLIVGLPLAVLGGVHGHLLPVALFGAEFADSGRPMQILFVTTLPLWLSAVTSTIIAASPRPWTNTALAGLMVVENVALNLLLIPVLGAMGAALATAATETVGLLLGALWIGRRVFPLTGFLRAAAGPLLAGGLLAAAALAAPTPWLDLLLLPLYAGLLFALKAVPDHERRILMNLLRGSKAP